MVDGSYMTYGNVRNSLTQNLMINFETKQNVLIGMKK